MIDFFANLLNPAQFAPHGQCYLWYPDVLWLNVGSDLIIGFAYFSIPITLFYFIKRAQNAPFLWMFALFAGFILFCGTTHFISVWTVWDPVYRLQGLVKLGTGIISLATAILLIPLVPRVLALKSPAQLEREVANRTKELNEMNLRLSQEIAERQRAQLTLNKTNQELLTQRERLLQSNRDLESFAYVASHDLQEPLRMISGYLQLLERRYSERLDNSGREFIDFAVDGAKRMQQLLSGLLDYSRIGRREKPFAPIELDSVMRQVLADLKSVIAETGAVIRYNSLPTVVADDVQLRQLLQNLLSNAIKFRRPQVTPEIDISVQRQADKWLFTVQDNGIGIDAKFSERIFQIFQRLHTRDEYPGTGLGLAICQRIVERHGGRIWIESSDDHGSVFYFTLQMIPEHAYNEGNTTLNIGSGEGLASA